MRWPTHEVSNQPPPLAGAKAASVVTVRLRRR